MKSIIEAAILICALEESPQPCLRREHWLKLFPQQFPSSHKQKEREHGRGKKERGKDYISEQSLLIATLNASPQLSQIAIEKWPVMQLLANPGPWLPSIIKSCLSRGPLSSLSCCVVSLSHLPATSWPAATAASGTRFPSTTSYSVQHIGWYGRMKKLKTLCYIFQPLQRKRGGGGHRVEWVLVFLCTLLLRMRMVFTEEFNPFENTVGLVSA